MPCVARFHLPVEAGFAFLLPDGQQRLPEVAVLVPLLPEPGAGDLMRVRYYRCDRLGRSTGRHELQEVARRFSTLASSGVTGCKGLRCRG